MIGSCAAASWAKARARTKMVPKLTLAMVTLRWHVL